MKLDARPPVRAQSVDRLGTEVDDATLVTRALDSDGWAQKVLYRRHVPRVTRVSARLLRISADIEDTVQDAFIDAFRQLDTLQDPARFGGWICRIAVHRAHNVLRRRRLRRVLGLEPGHEDESLHLQASVEASQEAKVELQRLGELLSTLPAKEQLCWVLRHLEGYKLAEVAELTGISLATVKRKLLQAQKRVDTHFAEPSDG